MYSFDFHSLSLTVGQDLAEYTSALLPGLGIHMYEAPDRSAAIRFRHEHAHFTSFMASGLADLYGVFSDYTLTFLYVVARRQIDQDPEGVLRVPITLEPVTLSEAEAAAISKAWRQIEELRAVLFGFGARGSIGDLAAPDKQDDFWEIYFDLKYNRIIQRFYRLLESLRSGTDIAVTAAAVPTVPLPVGQRTLTAGSVMEAYALTIEIFTTFFRGATTDLTTYSAPKVRDPGALYTVAIEYFLERTGSAKSVDDYMAGDAYAECMSCTALSFAAMQIPVMQELEGEVRVDGTLDQLSVPHRFVTLVDAIARGELRPLPSTVTRSSDDPTLLDWLHDCHALLGDRASLPMCRDALSRFENDAKLSAQSSEQMDMITMAWAARANFILNPGEYVLDAGLFAERYPCQARYVRTRDGKLVVLGDKDAFSRRYLAERSPLILEAAVFENNWDSVWAKFPEVSPENRLDVIQTSIVYADLLFGARSKDDHLSMQTVVLRTSPSQSS